MRKQNSLKSVMNDLAGMQFETSSKKKDIYFDSKMAQGIFDVLFSNLFFCQFHWKKHDA